MALGGQASTHRPHPLHSSVSTRSNPRSFFSPSIMLCSSEPFRHSSNACRRLARKVVRAHCEILKLRPKARIGNRNQSPGALAETLPMQIGNAIVGDHVVYIGA